MLNRTHVKKRQQNIAYELKGLLKRLKEAMLNSSLIPKHVIIFVIPQTLKWLTMIITPVNEIILPLGP